MSGLLVLALSPLAFAQSDTSGRDSISLFVGSLLPNQIDGVTEILPVFGGRYGLGTSFGTIELGVLNSHALGVDFTTFETSLRGDFPIGEGLEGLIYGGLDLNWYIPKDEESRRTETGFHAGAGLMMLVSNTVWLRSDLKFMGGPGTSLCLLFGVEYRGSEGGGQ